MSAGKARLGVVIPCFGAATTLRGAIDSVLVQKHPSVNVIVVDGASDDGTREILDSYGDRIAWISEKDDGQTDAINKGLRLINADIVTWLNADDRFLPGALAAVDDYFRDNADVDFAYGDIEFTDQENRPLSRRYEPSFNGFVLVYGHNLFADPTCFWRSQVLDKVGFLNGEMEYSMDYEFWVRCLDANIRFGQIKRCLAQFAIGSENKSIAHFEDMRREHFDVVIERRKWLNSVPEQWRYAVLRMLLAVARFWKILIILAERRRLPKSRFSRLRAKINY